MKPPPIPKRNAVIGTGPGAPYRDVSVGSLVISNLVTIGIAVLQQWPIGIVMWIYWCQSVTIGVFMAMRMARLQDFSTEGFSSNGRRVSETEAGKKQTVVFFCMHYGIFHFVYLVFLLVGARPSIADIMWMVVCVATFIANHRFSYRRNIEDDLGGKPNLGTMMFTPYARIIPMHLCMGLMAASHGKSNLLALAVFMLLKTGADVLMHIAEHHIYRKGRISGSTTD